MTYQFVVDNIVVFTGNVVSVVAIVVILLLIAVIAARLLWKKLRQNQVIKYEFITIIAHKFRTPLTQVKWILEMLIPDEPDPLRRKNFQDIQKANEKLIALTGTLIELTNKNRGAGLAYTFESVQMYDFVREIGDTMASLFQDKNLSFSVRCDDPGLTASINKTGIRFVIESLLENSATYSPPGRRVDAIIFRRRRKVCISITDDGIGIQAKDLPKIFSKFYRTRNARKVDTEGFGISLFMARSIVRRNKGKIKVYSAGVDQGSTFTVMLPLVK